jgi:UDP-N-acetyl-D-glucosamine dehydrogenase
MNEGPAAYAAQLLERIENKSATVGVVGLGYVGLPLAIELATAGFRVLGFDVSEAVCAGVNSGQSHIQDVPTERLSALVASKMVTATTDMDRLVEVDTISVCVPTPLAKTRDPDVSYVVAATEAIADTLRPGQLVILESTTYPGTTRELMLPALTASGLRVGVDFFLCFSPERVDPGNEVWQVHNTPKVLGGITRRCLAMGHALYSRVMDRVVTVSSPEAAELAKLHENTFRAVNIALVNEMAQVCDRLNVDVFEVIEAAATKPFGFMKFTPGPGIGGHCIPLDPHYLAWKMKTLNYKTRMIELAGEVNSEMPHYVVDKVQDALNRHRKPINGSRILVLGVAYKREIDDVRESPALDVMRLLEDKGALIYYHDPYVAYVRENGEKRGSVALTTQELAAADCVVIITDHQSIDYEMVVRHAGLVVDTRNATRGIEGGVIIGLSGERPRAVEDPEADYVPAGA